MDRNRVNIYFDLIKVMIIQKLYQQIPNQSHFEPNRIYLCLLDINNEKNITVIIKFSKFKIPLVKMNEETDILLQFVAKMSFFAKKK